ncbi:hypothetical protein SMACR_09563 [Sordaria macrospora]|uniref:WGS project CABT00000000 data, contig 2.124 n=2 Tax=Sordaria macrospora TaxID=5147 RepID=F7WCE1_SORMK|nr:uncharacterized protein SMAC_09563 [Sordaria macrospora k-hell]KAA8623969.1 hypothetical protein SMACR_09563 [Sordaria macrospora]WPJ57208.1 hypothetical protein SMAC4_09563 [Sordaria macrospora]CCC05602.1 unnamed protein product [Sordaria macrospora k-hell]
MRSEFFVQAVIATLLGLSAASTINPAAKTEDQAPNRDDSNLEISISQSIHRPHENSSSTSTVASILATRASPPPYRGNNERDASGHGVVSREVDQAQDETLHADDAHMNSARTGHVHRPHVSRRHGHARREFRREALADLNPAPPHNDISDMEILEDGSVGLRE